jgi:hypothetical protein
MADTRTLAADRAAAAEVESDVLTDFQTRFLYPFAYQRHAAREAGAALRAMKAPTQPGKDPRVVWECAEPSHAYRDELFEHVVHYLFANPEAAGCGYLRANKVLTDAWFGGAVLDATKLPLRLEGAAVEVFLSPEGVGVLSVTLAPAKKGLSPAEASAFNYRLAQFRRHDVGRLRLPHPEQNPAVWQRLSDEQKANVPPAPAEDAALTARLGVAGGRFDLEELLHFLLGPLERDFGGHRVQDELVVYSVARFGADADFADQTVCDRLAPFLSGLAQVEEPSHSGSRPSEVTTANVMLNRRHWAAAGLLGSAHLISDQPGDVEFNEQKLSVIRDKYFVTFLLALLHRLGLNRTIEEANARLQSGHAADEEKVLEALRADQLKFAVRGRFAQISCRQALHRYYKLGQEGLDVHDAWESVRAALADLDAKRHAERQQQIGRDTNSSLQNAEDTAATMARLAQGMNRNLDTVASVQVKVEQIEVAILSVYLAHLWHMIASGNKDLIKGLKELDPRYGAWFPGEGHEHFISWSAFLVAMVSLFLFGAYLLKNWSGYTVLAYGAVVSLGLTAFVVPWGAVLYVLQGGSTPGLGACYTVALLAAGAATATGAYLIRPWQRPAVRQTAA